MGTGGVEGFWRRVVSSRVPDSVLNMACASVTPSTLARYQDVIGSLKIFSADRGSDYLQLDVVSEYLETVTRTTQRPEATLRLVRSAISFLTELRGHTQRDAAILNRVCTGLIASRTSRPRLATPTADVSKITHHIRSLGHNSELTLRDLRMKSITLLSLAAFCRPSDLACVSKTSLNDAGSTVAENSFPRFRLASIKWLADGAQITFYGSKADKKMSANPVLIETSSDENLCPVLALKAYIEATEEFRAAIPDEPVYISLRAPYKGLSSSSIIQIISQALKDSGQDTGVTARSLRPTGARAAITADVDPSMVQRRGRWMSTDIFNRHYAGVTGPITDAVLLS